MLWYRGVLDQRRHLQRVVGRRGNGHRLAGAAVWASWTFMAVMACSGADNAGKDAPVVSSCRGCVDTVAISPEHLSFSRIVALDLDTQGNIFVADVGRQSVMVLGPDARLRRTFGRRGAGPGEFVSLLGIQVLVGDTLLACDPSLARLTLFAPATDSVVRTIRLSPAHGGIPTAVIQGDLEHPFIAGYEQPYVAGRPQESDSIRFVIAGVLNADGGVQAESILAIPGGQALVARSGGAVTARSHPFGRDAILHVAGSRLYYIVTDDPAIHSVSLTGGGARDHALPYRAVPLDRDVVEDTAATLQEAFRRPLRESSPRVWPVLREFVMDGDRFWVGVIIEPGRRIAWVAVDSTGHPVERIDMPWNVTLRAARGDRLYAVSLDADDVPRVVILSYRRPASQGG